MPVLTVIVIAILFQAQGTTPPLPAPFTKVAATEQKVAALAVWTGNVRLSVGTGSDAITADEVAYVESTGVMQLAGPVRYTVANNPQIYSSGLARHANGGVLYRDDVRIRLADGALLRADEAFYVRARGEVWLNGNVRVERLGAAALK